MLILTRKPNETIFIFPEDIPDDMTVKELFEGHQISVEVLGICGNQVKIGIDAPKRLSILRDDAVRD